MPQQPLQKKSQHEDHPGPAPPPSSPPGPFPSVSTVPPPSEKPFFRISIKPFHYPVFCPPVSAHLRMEFPASLHSLWPSVSKPGFPLRLHLQSLPLFAGVLSPVSACPRPQLMWHFLGKTLPDHPVQGTRAGREYPCQHQPLLSFSSFIHSTCHLKSPRCLLSCQNAKAS